MEHAAATYQQTGIMPYRCLPPPAGSFTKWVKRGFWFTLGFSVGWGCSFASRRTRLYGWRLALATGILCAFRPWKRLIRWHEERSHLQPPNSTWKNADKQQVSSFLSLTEPLLIITILHKLDIKDLANTGKTCKKLRQLSLDTVLWKDRLSTDFPYVQLKEGVSPHVAYRCHTLAWKQIFSVKGKHHSTRIPWFRGGYCVERFYPVGSSCGKLKFLVLRCPPAGGSGCLDLVTLDNPCEVDETYWEIPGDIDAGTLRVFPDGAEARYSQGTDVQSLSLLSHEVRSLGADSLLPKGYHMPVGFSDHSCTT